MSNPDSTDNFKQIIIESEYGDLSLVIPSDEEIQTIYYAEWFRSYMAKKYCDLQPDQIPEFKIFATIPYKEENGELRAVNPEDSEKLSIEIEEYNNLIEDLNPIKDWDKIAKAAEEGDPKAFATLALEYLSSKQYDLANANAMKGALKGNTDAIVILGMLAAHSDPELAVAFFKCASVGGNKYALLYLGQRYFTGNGIEKDDVKAFHCFERSAHQGLTEAAYRVGCMYLDGIGVNVHPSMGLAWLFRAANGGNHDAVNKIWQYYRSVGDFDHYIDTLKRGAANGIEECIAELRILSSMHES